MPIYVKFQFLPSSEDDEYIDCGLAYCSKRFEEESLGSDPFLYPSFLEASGMGLGLIIVMHYINTIDEISIQSSSWESLWHDVLTIRLEVDWLII